MTNIARESRETAAVTPTVLGTWCETCEATGPTIDVTGLGADTTMQRVNEKLKPWIKIHGAIMDMKRSYRTADGAEVSYHQPKFGPIGS